MTTTSSLPRRLTVALLVALALGAHSPLAAQDRPATESEPTPIILREGDELQISFPGAPTLNTQQRVRSDGRITLDLVGEVVATGMTPAQFQDRLIELYSTQLVSREVTVRLISRSFYVYVNGSVDKRGRLDFDRPVSLLEAVMAAGFTDGAVNLGRVRLLRVEGGRARSFTIDLNRAIDGRGDEIPELKQGDMIIVPGRII